MHPSVKIDPQLCFWASAEGQSFYDGVGGELTPPVIVNSV